MREIHSINDIQMTDNQKEDQSISDSVDSTGFPTKVTDQVTTESVNEKDEQETVEDEDVETEEKNDLRINQPEYTQLLKDLDFSHTRMVDVTNLLSDEGGSYVTADENENHKKFSSDEKYRSLSTSSDEGTHHESSDNENFKKNPNDLDIDLKQLSTEDTPKEDDDEQEAITPTSKSKKNSRSTNIQDDNLSSIPRLSTNINSYIESDEQSPEHILTWENLVHGTDPFGQTPTIFIISQPYEETHITPTKEEQPQSVSSSEPPPQQQQTKTPSPRQKTHHRSHQVSVSSDTDDTDAAEYDTNRLRRKPHSTSQQQLSVDDEHNESKQNASFDHYRPYTTASDILLRRLSNQQTDRTSPIKKKSPRKSSVPENIQSPTAENWISMFEKLEREHKERLDRQQKQYEEYMQHLEEKMKQRFDNYLSTTNSLQESKCESLNESTHLCHSHSAAPIDSNYDKYKPDSSNYHYRPLAKELINHSHSTDSANYDRRQLNGTNLSRSQSRDDISNLRTELSAKHIKHVSDLKLYYEHEISDLKKQLNISKMGNTSNTTRQSMETIERINNDNIRLHDEMKELRHSLKVFEQENHSLKRQIDELRDQLNNKELELKTSHRSISDLEQQLNASQNIKGKQDDKFRQADRQALYFREENEKITNELNLTRERLLRLEERYRELENERKPLRIETNIQRVNEEPKFPTTMSLNMPTSREYGRFTLTSSRYSSSTISTPRDGNIINSGRFTSNGSNDLFHQGNSSRTLNTLNDYINEKPIFPQTYVPPSRHVYSPPKSSPTRQYIPVTDLVDDQIKQSEQLEEKFDDLLKKKRDLESRINRIPTRNLTSTDRQLLEVLEREIERVEAQISSVKLELRKMNVLRTH